MEFVSWRIRPSPRILAWTVLVGLWSPAPRVAVAHTARPTVVSAAGGWLCGSPQYDLLFAVGEPGAGVSQNSSFLLWAGFHPPVRVTVLCPTPAGVGSTSRETRVAITALSPSPMMDRAEIGFRAPSGSVQELSVAHPSGRIVRHLPASPPGGASVVWDGRDDRGRLVASGVYIVVLRSLDGSDTRKLMVLR